MIVLDANVLIVDIRYPRDAKSAVNRQVLDFLRQKQLPLAIVSHTLLEVLGVCSFGLSRQGVLDLAAQIPVTYGLSVHPDPTTAPNYLGVGFAEVRDAIAQRLSVGDAITLLQIEKLVPHATCFLSWDARHFVGRIAIPVFTPQQWWQQQTTP